MKEIIRLVDVYKIYEMGENKVYALSGVNLSVQKSEFLVILGPSGSGKSTMMNLVGCLDTPTKGKIYLEEHDISYLHESDLAQIRGRKIGFIFQQFNLISTLTAKENIILPMSFQGFSKNEQEKKANELLRLVQLEERSNHYPKQLSGGQQQRVAIARALVNDPEVILADEPTGNLDSKTGQIVLDFLEKLHKQGKTIIVVTHDVNVAFKYAERICYLKDGKIEKIEKRKK
ncbi:MAG: ABC transporter ATP-binding protein [Candidatus Pacearchaeota archaeon]